MISIIIPTYNEAGNIGILLKKIAFYLKKIDHEIIIVDDNSPDKTWKIASEIGRKNKNIKVIKRLNKRGLTSAFNCGIKHSSGEIIGWLDADLSHPPKLLRVMLKQLQKNDAVIASRYVNDGSDRRRECLAVWFSKIINLLSRILLFNDITDYTSGYILLKKSWLKNYRLTGDYGEYFIDLIFNLKKNGAKIKEIGYINYSRIQGISKTATNIFDFFRRGIKYVVTTFSLWLRK
jgi:dolichol-phosphate mannosyltransferase